MDWVQFQKQFELTDLCVQHMKTFADIPFDLAWLSTDEFSSFYKEGFITISKLRKIKSWCNTWETLDYVLHLGKDTIDIIKAKYDLPDDIKINDYDDNDDFHIAGVKDATAKRILSFCQSLFTDPYHYNFTDLRKTASNPIPIGIEHFNEIFASNSVIFKQKHVLDTVLTGLFKSNDSLENVLSGIQKNVNHLILKLGYISDLTPLIKRLNEFPNLKLIDLSVNRLGSDQLDNIMTIAKKCCAVVNSNPCWMTESAEQIQKCIARDPETFLKIIWIHENWIASDCWSSLMGPHAAQYLNTFKDIHAGFYKVRKNFSGAIKIENILLFN